MESKAVICRGTGAIPSVERIMVEPPRRAEVLIKLSACGVCHSDLSVVDGTIPMPRPIVLGHEGAGTIIEVGHSVTRRRAPLRHYPTVRCGHVTMTVAH